MKDVLNCLIITKYIDLQNRDIFCLFNITVVLYILPDYAIAKAINKMLVSDSNKSVVFLSWL